MLLWVARGLRFDVMALIGVKYLRVVGMVFDVVLMMVVMLVVMSRCYFERSQVRCVVSGGVLLLLRMMVVIGRRGGDRIARIERGQLILGLRDLLMLRIIGGVMLDMVAMIRMKHLLMIRMVVDMVLVMVLGVMSWCDFERSQMRRVFCAIILLLLLRMVVMVVISGHGDDRFARVEMGQLVLGLARFVLLRIARGLRFDMVAVIRMEHLRVIGMVVDVVLIVLTRCHLKRRYMRCMVIGGVLLLMRMVVMVVIIVHLADHRLGLIRRRVGLYESRCRLGMVIIDVHLIRELQFVQTEVLLAELQCYLFELLG